MFNFDKADFNKVDFHVHSLWSLAPGGVPDGSILLNELIEDAEKRGLLVVGLTEHWGYDTRAFKFIEERKRLEREINESQTSLKIYFSSEVNIKNDKGESPVDTKRHARIIEVMDYLSASPHLSVNGKSSIPLNKDKREIIDYGHRAHMNIAKNRLFKFICHPYIPLINLLRKRGFAANNGEAFAGIPVKYLREFAEAAAQFNKGIEISNVALTAEKEGNPQHEGFRKACKVFVKELIKAGAKISVGSDSHNRNDGWSWVGKTEEAVKLIKECGGDKKYLWLPE